MCRNPIRATVEFIVAVPVRLCQSIDTVRGERGDDDDEDVGDHDRAGVQRRRAPAEGDRELKAALDEATELEQDFEDLRSRISANRDRIHGVIYLVNDWTRRVSGRIASDLERVIHNQS
jgi:hypothetical protein